MSYDDYDAAWDDLYDRMSDELYPDHYEKAVDKFTRERLKSYYEKNPLVMRPAMDSLQLGKKLLGLDEPIPALVFFASANELLLKATLLRPVVYGLVHNDALADIVMLQAPEQPGFERYEKLLSGLFSAFTNAELKQVKREGANDCLLEEYKLVQKTRNRIIHRRDKCTKDEAANAFNITVAVFEDIVRPVLHALGLTVIERGEIEPQQ